MKTETSVIVLKGSRFEEFRKVAPKTLSDLERSIEARDNELDRLFGTKTQRDRRPELIELEDNLACLRVIEYGIKWGDTHQLSQRDARSWLARFMNQDYIEHHGFAPAQKLVEALLEADPSDKPYVEELIEPTEFLKTLGKLKYGLAALSEIECFPSTPSIQLYAQLMQSKFQDKENPYQKAEAEAYLRAAEINFERGRSNEAVNYLNRSFEINPKNPEINYTIAKYIIDSTEDISLAVLENALPYAEKAVILAPTRSDFRQLYETLNKYRTAIDAEVEAETAIRDFI